MNVNNIVASALGPAVIASVAQAYSQDSENQKFPMGSIMGIDWKTGDTIFEEKAFQYWPETITDGYEVGWNFKNIPGASHPLAQWGSNNGRKISFELKFGRIFSPEVNSIGGINGFDTGTIDPFSETHRQYNVDIAAAVAFFRALAYPEYVKGVDGAYAKPPVLLMLNLPNMALNEDGSDTIYCVLTSISDTYNKGFIDGTPKFVTSALSFQQVVQIQDAIVFPDRKTFLARTNHHPVRDYKPAGLGAIRRGSGNVRLPAPVKVAL